jgi:thiosulfate dehydrogenase [quinone] large subunit
MSDATPDLLRRRRANGWPVLPMRIFLASVFLFAGYAKLVYPHFLDPKSGFGFRASVAAAKHGTPIGGLLGPLTDHASLFGHLTAFAELAIGLGLLVGLLTRVAAAGGMVLMAMIVLSVDWPGVRQYTGSSGWFTSVDLAVAAGLSVFLLGGADPFSLDALFWRARLRRRAADDAEPGFRDNELAESRARLQGRPYPDDPITERLPATEENSLWNTGPQWAGGEPRRPDEPVQTPRAEPVDHDRG